MFTIPWISAPLSQTVVDFWRLVWQEKVQTIVMLNSAAEGKLKKSEIYWPEVGSREHGPFMITQVENQVFADYTIRTMQVVVSDSNIRFSYIYLAINCQTLNSFSSLCINHCYCSLDSQGGEMEYVNTKHQKGNSVSLHVLARQRSS